MLRPYLFAHLFLGVVVLTLPALLRGGDDAMAPVTAYSAATVNDRHTLEQETFFLINQYRRASKLPLLQWDGDISEAARNHSRDMATGKVDFGHDGFSKRVAGLGKVMSGLNGAGENVFKSDDPNDIAKFAVEIWLKSPPHLKNIRGDYNYSGMGVWQDKDGMIYFTQIFVKLKPPAQEAQTPSPQVVSPLGLLATPKTR